MKRKPFSAPLITFLASATIIGSTLLGQGPNRVESKEKPVIKPLKALLIAGGCCHDYKGQHEALFKGIQERANVQVDVWWTDDKSVNPPLPLYDDPDWAKGYDVIIHDECAAGNKDLKALKRILDAHQTIPSVHLHCAMHSFRGDTDKWFKHLGIQSSRHGPQEPIDVKYVAPDHPILAGLEDWTTIKEELYNNVDVYDATPLAMGTQKYTRDGKETTDVAIVAWTNETQGAPSFSTTLGHNTETVADDRYLNLVTRGLLWTCGKLNEDYFGKAFNGTNKITFLPKVEAPKPKPEAALGKPPKDALLVKISASSEEKNKSNFAWKAIDGNPETRWCAANNSMPQSITLEFDKPQKIYAASIKWESQNNVYRYVIEHSMDDKGSSWLLDGKAGPWGIWVDGRTNETTKDIEIDLPATDAKFIRITVLGTDKGGWSSIREIGLKGVGFKSLYPKLEGEQAEEKKKQDEAANAPFTKEGNITPKIVKLTPKEEADILGNVTVPEGFDVTVFSDWRSANYPVYVAASPNGDLYVSSDGNGSLGREPHRGRVLRLRDTDQDGRADEVTEFIKDIDSPRGLLWDHDRLYLLHPPHISVFTDKDGDGVAEESKRLIEGIAFGFEDRPADHTTNDITMGIDGWIYIAGGDFGFMKAKGTDGRELQHRGGGVIRFRPDGSELELFATGTRNILGTPISPLLDMFARDNTNDGGGWDVRFHHFTGLEDHGYPRLYKNFPEEHIHPLADYGGGSGCGAVYIHEPGFPDEWNKAPFTADWGTGALYRHSVQRVGATFEEVTEPQPFIKMTRPTDGDVDGMSAVYQASWRGPATFKWAGADTGYIVRVTPKGYTPEPLPDYEKMDPHDLIAALDSPSHIRTLAAQRALIRRELTSPAKQALWDLILNRSTPLRSQIAALYIAKHKIGTDWDLEGYVMQFDGPGEDDHPLSPFYTRSFGDLSIPEKGDTRELMLEILERELESGEPRRIIETIITSARLGTHELADGVAQHLGSADPSIAHLAFQALARLGASEAALKHLNSSTHGKGASFALMRMHDPKLIDTLIGNLASERDPDTRKRIFSILARLAQREDEWTGDSWGTRPDTRGPYYQLTSWSETDKILATLKSALDTASSDEATHIIKEMSRNRIQSNEALNQILTMAVKNPKLIPDAVTQLATANEIPAEGIDILLTAVTSKDEAFNHSVTAEAIGLLAKTDSKEGFEASLSALAQLKAHHAAMIDAQKAEQAKKSADNSGLKYAKMEVGNAKKSLETAAQKFLKSPKLENHHLAIETLANEELSSPRGLWANAGLIELASRANGSPESRELSEKAITAAWNNSAQKKLLIEAAALTKNRFLDDRIQAAMKDPDKTVATVAKAAAKELKIKAKANDKTPKIGTLAPKEALAAAINHKGDPSLGEAVFARATCSACHTVSQDEPQKGPYLGNIFETYKRPELAEAIIDPNKTIAQGFATNVITPKEGTPVLGFVTNEQGDQVTIRDIASTEHVFKKDEIKTRETLPMSIMPPALMNNFTVHEMASLLDYLEVLSKKK